MRLQNLALLTLLAVGLGVPAQAQTVTFDAQVKDFIFTTGVSARSSPDMVIARLMSFDRNADGTITADELPERMHNLLVPRKDGSAAALDSADVRKLALSANQFPGLAQGNYGFLGSSGFDTSQRIEDAIDDLRLAADVKSRAVEIVRTFISTGDARAENEMMATLGRFLTDEQLLDFRTNDGGHTVSVPAVRRDGVTFFGARPDEAAGQERVMVSLRVAPSADLAFRLDRYTLGADAKREAQEAVGQFRMHRSGLVSETERAALLEQFRDLLSAEQRDDLRAALSRRPLGKLNAGVDVKEFILTQGAVVVSEKKLR
jgi:hypothetical protein